MLRGGRERGSHSSQHWLNRQDRRVHTKANAMHHAMTSVAPESVESLQADDGYTLRFRWWPGTRDAACLVLLHGGMSNTSWLRGLAQGLQRRGWNVLGHD